MIQDVIATLTSLRQYPVNGIVTTPHGDVALWVIDDCITYLEDTLKYGSWVDGGRRAPKGEVVVLASWYGIAL